MDIRDEHMKMRCYFMWAMCCMSLYNWYAYSLFEPINNDILKPYYLNCALFIYYLFWDSYKMLLSSDRKILYRTDLMIHHCISLFTYISLINYTSLQVSHVLVMECISLLNYVLRNRPKTLAYYRLFCIFIVRIPMCVYMLNYNWYHIMFYAPTMELYYQHQPYENIYFLFLAYDACLLKQLHKILTMKKV